MYYRFRQSATDGVGFVLTAGGFVDFPQLPQSRGTNSGMAVFSIPISVGVNLTDRLSNRRDRGAAAKMSAM
jgi:hypothetical protein